MSYEQTERNSEIEDQDASKRETEPSRKTVLIGVGSLFALLVVGFFVVSFRKPASDGGQREPVVKRSDRKSKAPFESKPLVGPLPDGRVAQVLSFVSAHRSAFAVASVAAVLAVAVAVYYLASKSQPEEDLLRQAEEAKRLQTEETERFQAEEADRLKAEETERLKAEDAERLKANEAKRFQAEEAERLQAEEEKRSQVAQRQKLADEESTVIMANRWMAALFVPFILPLVQSILVSNEKVESYIGKEANFVLVLLLLLLPLVMPLLLGGFSGIASLMIYFFIVYMIMLRDIIDLKPWAICLQVLAVHLVFQGVLFLAWCFLDIKYIPAVSLSLMILNLAIKDFVKNS